MTLNELYDLFLLNAFSNHEIELQRALDSFDFSLPEVQEKLLDCVFDFRNCPDFVFDKLASFFHDLDYYDQLKVLDLIREERENLEEKFKLEKEEEYRYLKDSIECDLKGIELLQKQREQIKIPESSSLLSNYVESDEERKINKIHKDMMQKAYHILHLLNDKEELVEKYADAFRTANITIAKCSNVSREKVEALGTILDYLGDSKDICIQYIENVLMNPDLYVYDQFIPGTSLKSVEYLLTQINGNEDKLRVCIYIASIIKHRLYSSLNFDLPSLGVHLIELMQDLNKTDLNDNGKELLYDSLKIVRDNATFRDALLEKADLIIDEYEHIKRRKLWKK